jgi:hypothetical protein
MHSLIAITHRTSSADPTPKLRLRPRVRLRVQKRGQQWKLWRSGVRGREEQNRASFTFSAPGCL